MDDGAASATADHGLAVSALARYSLGTHELTPVGVSENTTFRVDAADGSRYLLRVHRSSARLDPAFRSPAVIRSELQWLLALARETDLVVQAPVANRDGDLVTEVLSAQGEPVTCSVLRWIEGERFDQQRADAEVVARRCGGVSAAVSEHATDWSQPPGFTRPDYGAAWVEEMARELKPTVDCGFISAADYALFEQASDVVARAVTDLSADAWGLIHADLHPNNLVVKGTTVCPIDFSLCGFGPYLLDLATTLQGLRPDLRQPAADAYSPRCTIDEAAVRLMEGIAFSWTLGCFVFYLDTPEQQGWLRQRMPGMSEIAQGIVEGRVLGLMNVPRV